MPRPNGKPAFQRLRQARAIRGAGLRSFNKYCRRRPIRRGGARFLGIFFPSCRASFAPLGILRTGRKSALPGILQIPGAARTDETGMAG
jgi:hypothetical protein